MNLKLIVYSATFFLVLLPFILVTDLFPFLRFGMFAEPVKEDFKAEIFYVMVKGKDGKWQTFNPEKYELQEESFQYLARNYFYRDETVEFLMKLQQSEVLKGELLRFYKVTFPISDPFKKDTSIIAEIGRDARK